MSNANMKEQEKRIKEIRILLKVLTYLGFYNWEEEETSGDYEWTFQFNEHLISQMPFDETKYLMEINDDFLIEFKKEPHKTVSFNLDNQVCGYAILQNKDTTFAMKNLAIIIGRAPISPED